MTELTLLTTGTALRQIPICQRIDLRQDSQDSKETFRGNNHLCQSSFSIFPGGPRGKPSASWGYIYNRFGAKIRKESARKSTNTRPIWVVLLLWPPNKKQENQLVGDLAGNWTKKNLRKRHEILGLKLRITFFRIAFNTDWVILFGRVLFKSRRIHTVTHSWPWHSGTMALQNHRR